MHRDVFGTAHYPSQDPSAWSLLQGSQKVSKNFLGRGAAGAAGKAANAVRRLPWRLASDELAQDDQELPPLLQKRQRAAEYGAGEGTAVRCRAQFFPLSRVRQKAALHDDGGKSGTVEDIVIAHQCRAPSAAGAGQGRGDAGRQAARCGIPLFIVHLRAAARGLGEKAVLMDGDDEVGRGLSDDAAAFLHISALEAGRGQPVQPARVFAREHHAKAGIGKQLPQFFDEQKVDIALAHAARRHARVYPAVPGIQHHRKPARIRRTDGGTAEAHPQQQRRQHRPRQQGAPRQCAHGKTCPRPFFLQPRPLLQPHPFFLQPRPPILQPRGAHPHRPARRGCRPQIRAAAAPLPRFPFPPPQGPFIPPQSPSSLQRLSAPQRRPPRRASRGKRRLPLPFPQKNKTTPFLCGERRQKSCGLLYAF